MVALSADALGKNYIRHGRASLLLMNTNILSYAPLTFFTRTLPLQASGEFLANL